MWGHRQNWTSCTPLDTGRWILQGRLVCSSLQQLRRRWRNPPLPSNYLWLIVFRVKNHHLILKISPLQSQQDECVSFEVEDKSLNVRDLRGRTINGNQLNIGLTYVICRHVTDCRFFKKENKCHQDCAGASLGWN